MPKIRPNTFYFGDNIDVLREFPDQAVDLIYLDPPFNSKKEYNQIFADAHGKPSAAQVKAFSDYWRWGEQAERSYLYLTDSRENQGRVAPAVSRLTGALRAAIGENDVMAYLVMMTERLVELRRVLKPTGSIYLHCDPGASHYLKVVMDAIFGGRNFRREVVWRSGWVSGFKSRAKNWIRNHDVLLYYVKERGQEWTFNKDKAYVPHRPGYARRGGGGNPLGVAIDDVWTDIYSPWIMSYSKEKLGWETQKPLDLLRRIIEVSSNPGDLVLDPFCGCSTALVAAEELGRRWIGIDITPLAIAVVKHRFQTAFGKTDIFVDGEPADVDGARELAEGPEGRYRFQWWAVGRIGARPLSEDEKKKGPDEGIDGEMTFPETDGDVKRVLISVKSGRVGAAQVRELVGTVNRENAAIGLFVTLSAPTEAMKKEAVKAGWYESPRWAHKFRRVQILTAEEVIQGVKGDLPPATSSGLPDAARLHRTEGAEQLPLPDEAQGAARS